MSRLNLTLRELSKKKDDAILKVSRVPKVNQANPEISIPISDIGLVYTDSLGYGDLCFMDLVNMVQNHLCGDNYKAFENFFSWKEIKTAKFYSEYCGDVKLPSNRMGYTYCYVSQIDLEADFTYEMSHFRNINLDLLGKMEAYVKMVIRKYCLDWEEIGYKYLYEPDEEEVEELQFVQLVKQRKLESCLWK